jgi:ribosomal protein S18 acetylase RimI-like enzyme
MVKVVAGNPAIKLYEKYGFQLSSMILWRNF